MEKRVITEERAMQILSNRPEITETGVFAGIRIGNVGLAHKDGSPFIWEQSGEQYGIVNLQAFSTYQADQAEELMEAGDYQGAINQNLSINLPIDDAKALIGSLATATVEFGTYTNKDGIEVLTARRMNVDQVVKAKATARFAKAGANAQAIPLKN